MNTGMTMYQNQSKQVMKLRKPFTESTVRTDRTIPNNKPDIVIRDNKQGTYMLIGVAIPGEQNVIKKEAEKNLR